MIDRATVAARLDEFMLAGMRRWGKGERFWTSEAQFDVQARTLFAEQIAANAAYGKFAASLGFGAGHEPRSWREIPAVPSSAFKDGTLATFDPQSAELEFHTSGTTAERAGRHFVRRAAFYDASLIAGFDRFMLADGARLRYLNLVPNPKDAKHSSLGYMMGHVSVLRGDGKAGYFLRDDGVDAQGFAHALEAATADAQPVCIATTAFALVALLEALGDRRFHLPQGSRVMETGGFKGRVAAVSRDDLYARAGEAFGIPQASIVAEYGMTEMLSQFYDSLESRGSPLRVKAGPPWVRTLVVDAAGNEVPFGETGFLRHFDLANRSSALALDTEDRGYAVEGGFVLLGRDAEAEPRGCSLTVEDLVRATVVR